jgi:hypothetical protein
MGQTAEHAPTRQRDRRVIGKEATAAPMPLEELSILELPHLTNDAVRGR